MQTRGGGGGGLLLEIKTAGLLFEISCANSWGGGGLLFGMGFSRLRPLGFFSRLVMQTRGGGGFSRLRPLGFFSRLVVQTRGETSFRDGLLLEIKTAGLLFEISYANSWEGGGFFSRWTSSQD